MGPTQLLAHEAWFVPQPERLPPDWHLLTAGATLTAVSVALAAVVVFTAVDKRWGEPRLRLLDPLTNLRPHLTRILAIAVGLALLGTALIDGYLAPSMVLPRSFPGRLLSAVELTIGVLLIVGWRRRWVAALLVAAGPLGMIAYGVRPVLERADLLGAAAYLVLAHGDDVGAEHRARLNPVASLVMRGLASVAIAVLAFTEKLLNPGLAHAFLDLHPEFDLFHFVGLGSAAHFISFAATMELVLAALLLAGRLPRLTVVLVGTPFVVTAPLLGARELVGHLPLYGVLLVVLVEAQVRRLPAQHEESPHAVEASVPDEQFELATGGRTVPVRPRPEFQGQRVARQRDPGLPSLGRWLAVAGVASLAARALFGSHHDRAHL